MDQVQITKCGYHGNIRVAEVHGQIHMDRQTHEVSPIKGHFLGSVSSVLVPESTVMGQFNSVIQFPR